MTTAISDDTARTLRRLWFDYVDTIEPIRPRLHAYCVKLTGSIFDGEDLLQDTLLRGFGVIARADYFAPEALGTGERWEKPSAYLARIATNLWVDRVRRARHEATIIGPLEEVGHAQEAVVTRAAASALFDRASPQERAALVLKDVLDFSVKEIAELLSTTEGAVKTALHRARERFPEPVRTPPRHARAAADLVDRFVAALNTRDVAKITALLLEPVTWEVHGVGGERGKKTIWLDVAANAPQSVASERRSIEGEDVVIHTFKMDGTTYLGGLARLEEADGRIARIIVYHFCPDTLALAGKALGLAFHSNGYHQTEDVIANMVRDTRLPWTP